MRKGLAVTAAIFSLTSAGHALAAPPSLGRCPQLAPREAMEDDRKVPLTIPRQFAQLVRATRDRIAVSTLTGAVHCIDTRDFTVARDYALSSDGRFFSFSWGGYEAGGYILVDRTGRGQTVDTGDRPMFSPSRRKFAAIEISESGFGSLNGFAVWQVDPVGIRRLTFLENLPQMQDWRLDGWSGEACIDISAIAFGQYPDNEASLRKVPRVRYVARPATRGWSVVRGRCPRA
ncbi:MAG: hypothetical protein AB7F98_14150 [Novosphingobium sp.]